MRDPLKIYKTKWTKHEDDIILRKYNNIPLKELAKILPGRSKDAIRNRAYRLGLKKQRSRELIKNSLYSKYSKTNTPKTIDDALEAFDTIYPECAKILKCEDCIFMHSKLNLSGKQIPLCVVLDSAKNHYRRRK